MERLGRVGLSRAITADGEILVHGGERMRIKSRLHGRVKISIEPQAIHIDWIVMGLRRWWSG